MNQVYVSFTKKSKNAKTGPIPTTTSSRNTCPESCPLNHGNGCYADAGFYTRIHWDSVSKGVTGGPYSELYPRIQALPAGTIWRHNVAGDLPSEGGQIDRRILNELIHANEGRRGFTYTHHDVLSSSRNRRLIAAANRYNFTINLSTNDISECDAYYDLGCGPVVTIVPEGSVQNLRTPKGRDVVICPATYKEDVTCATCKMCAIPDRKTIIGFPAHGSRRKKICLSTSSPPKEKECPKPANNSNG